MLPHAAASATLRGPSHRGTAPLTPSVPVFRVGGLTRFGSVLNPSRQSSWSASSTRRFRFRRLPPSGSSRPPPSYRMLLLDAPHHVFFGLDACSLGLPRRLPSCCRVSRAYLTPETQKRLLLTGNSGCCLHRCTRCWTLLLITGSTGCCFHRWHLLELSEFPGGTASWPRRPDLGIEFGLCSVTGSTRP